MNAAALPPNTKINVSQVFAGQMVGVKQGDEHMWLVTFMHDDLGYVDDETGAGSN
jgi:putative transposase